MRLTIPDKGLTIPGVDYAWSHPDPDALKAGGFKFAMRYLSHDASKDLTAGEFAALRKRGIAVGLVWESAGRRAAQGHEAGRLDGLSAKALAAKLGLDQIPIYFAVDWDVSDAEKSSIRNYLFGAGAALGRARVGVYGSYYVIRDCGTACTWYWQTYAWSGGQVHPKAHIYQYSNGVKVGGGTVDLNKASLAGTASLRPIYPTPAPAAPVHRASKRRLAVWKTHLRIARAARKLVGKNAQLDAYIAKLVTLIARG